MIYTLYMYRQRKLRICVVIHVHVGMSPNYCATKTHGFSDFTQPFFVEGCDCFSAPLPHVKPKRLAV